MGIRPSSMLMFVLSWLDGNPPFLHAYGPAASVVPIPPRAHTPCVSTMAHHLSIREATLDEEVAEYKSTYAMKLIRIRMTRRRGFVIDTRGIGTRKRENGRRGG